jgi:hypothetical protein
MRRAPARVAGGSDYISRFPRRHATDCRRVELCAMRASIRKAEEGLAAAICAACSNHRGHRLPGDAAEVPNAAQNDMNPVRSSRVPCAAPMGACVRQGCGNGRPHMRPRRGQHIARSLPWSLNSNTSIRCGLFGVGQDYDHLLSALGKSSFDGLRYVDFVRPLLCADGVAMQRVHHRVTSAVVGRIARRKKDKSITVHCIALPGCLPMLCHEF